METHGPEQRANTLSDADYRAPLNGSTPDIWADGQDAPMHADSENGLEALKQDSADDLDRRIELTDEPERKHGKSGGGSRFNRRTSRVLALALLILALAVVAPFLWNYLQSYESTDDAQIDGHIDPISSRIDGTVIRVHAEDDDRVTKGELLVEIDPRDYRSRGRTGQGAAGTGVGSSCFGPAGLCRRAGECS